MQTGVTQKNTLELVFSWFLLKYFGQKVTGNYSHSVDRIRSVWGFNIVKICLLRKAWWWSCWIIMIQIFCVMEPLEATIMGMLFIALLLPHNSCQGEWMDGWTGSRDEQWNHLPPKPMGFPCQATKQEMRKTLPKSTNIQCYYPWPHLKLRFKNQSKN